MHDPKIEELVRRDPRYPCEAYEFVFAALACTQKMIGRAAVEGTQPGREEEYHVSGQQLVLGIRDLALREFGMMARTVFRQWGINRTDDFGEIVFNLVEAGLMSKTNEDNRADFRGIYDLDEALVRGYRISGKGDSEEFA